MNQFILCLMLACAFPGAATASAGDQTRASAFLKAVSAKDSAAALHFLAEGLPVDTRNDQGRTPLILAVSSGNLEMTRLLVEHGADVNARTTTETGSTVLCFALEGGNSDLVDYLLNHGAKVNGKGKNGQTPLHYAAAHGLTNFVKLLIDHGADLDLFSIPDTKGNLTTPLIAAAANGHLETVRLLIEHGANLEMVNNAGETVLMDACKRPYPEIIKLLVDKGANVNATGPLGHTALIYAAAQGRIDILRILLAAGADPLATATDNPEQHARQVRFDAADLAEQNGHLEALLLLLRAQEQALKARRARLWDILS